MKELTKAEEEIMQVIWDIREGFVRDILEHLSDPKPAYNTVSTIARMLEKKGFVSHKSYGKSHQYYPLVSKNEYSKKQVKNLLKNYFKNSYSEMVSFFTHEKDLSLKEMQEIQEILNKEIKNKKE